MPRRRSDPEDPSLAVARSLGWWLPGRYPLAMSLEHYDLPSLRQGAYALDQADSDRAPMVTLQTAVVAFSLVLLRGPALFFGVTPLGKLVGLLPFAAVIALAGTSARADARVPDESARARGAVRATVAAFVLMTLIAVLRGSGSTSLLLDAATLGILVVFGHLVFVNGSRARRNTELLALALAPSLYVTVNLLLHLAGVAAVYSSEVAVGDPSSMLSLIGLSAQRTLFPLGQGVNTFAIICGVGLVTSTLVASRESAELKWPVRFVVLANLICLFLTDARGPMLWSVLTIGLVSLLHGRLRILRFLSFAFPISPFLMTSLSGVFVERADSTRGALGGRLSIWEPAIEKIEQLSTGSLIGWGRVGQGPSGVWAIQRYRLFRDRADYWTSGLTEPLFGSHNAMLQTALDSGLLGVAIVSAVFFFALSDFGEAADEGATACLAITGGLVSLIGIGMLEAAPTEFSPEALTWFGLVAVALLGVARDRSLGLGPGQG